MNICNELWNDTATTAVKHQDLITLRVVRNISWARWPPCVSYYRRVERTVAVSWPWRYSTSSSTCRWVFGSLRSRGLSSCRPRPHRSLPPCCSGSSPSCSETVSWTALRHSRMNLEIDDNKVWIQFYQLDDLFEYIIIWAHTIGAAAWRIFLRLTSSHGVFRHCPRLPSLLRSDHKAFTCTLDTGYASAVPILW